MNIDKELLDVVYLNDNFSLSKLWSLNKDMVQLKAELEKLKIYTITLQKLKDLKEIENKLFHINRNINLIEEVMEIKELDIFTLAPYGEICLN
jgi:hypothetical protein